MAGDGTLRFGLHQAASPSLAGTEHQGPVSTRRQLLELERRSIVEALQKSGGKIYGANGAAEIVGVGKPECAADRFGLPDTETSNCQSRLQVGLTVDDERRQILRLGRMVNIFMRLSCSI